MRFREHILEEQNQSRQHGQVEKSRLQAHGNKGFSGL